MNIRKSIATTLIAALLLQGLPVLHTAAIADDAGYEIIQTGTVTVAENALPKTRLRVADADGTTELRGFGIYSSSGYALVWRVFDSMPENFMGGTYWSFWVQPPKLHAGNNYLSVWAVDVFGNWVSGSESIYYIPVDYNQPDTEPPKITFELPEGKYDDPETLITITYTDNGGNLNATVRIVAEDGTETVPETTVPYDSNIGYVYTKPLRDLLPGTYTVYAKAADLSGNSAEQSLQYTYEAVSVPDIEIDESKSPLIKDDYGDSYVVFVNITDQYGVTPNDVSITITDSEGAKTPVSSVVWEGSDGNVHTFSFKLTQWNRTGGVFGVYVEAINARGLSADKSFQFELSNSKPVINEAWIDTKNSVIRKLAYDATLGFCYKYKIIVGIDYSDRTTPQKSEAGEDVIKLEIITAEYEPAESDVADVIGVVDGDFDEKVIDRPSKAPQLYKVTFEFDKYGTPSGQYWIRATDSAGNTSGWIKTNNNYGKIADRDMTPPKVQFEPSNNDSNSYTITELNQYITIKIKDESTEEGISPSGARKAAVTLTKPSGESATQVFTDFEEEEGSYVFTYPEPLNEHGVYLFSVVATDKAGGDDLDSDNTSEPYAQEYIVNINNGEPDTSSPQVTFKPIGKEYKGEGSVETVVWDETELQSGTLSVEIDDVVQSVIDIVKEGKHNEEANTYSYTYTFTNAGIYRLTVKANDGVNTETDVSEIYVIEAESVPRISFVGVPSYSKDSDNYINASHSNLNITAYDSDGILNFSVNVNGVSQETTETTAYTHSFDYSFGSDGRYEFSVTATDTKETSTTTSVVFIYDSTPPVINALVPTDANYVQIESVLDDNLATYTALLNGAPAAIDEQNRVYAAATSSTIIIVAQDKAGNSATKQFFIPYDASSPQIIATPESGTFRKLESVTFNITDDIGIRDEDYDISVTSSQNTEKVILHTDTKLKVVQYTLKSDGKYIFTVSATDTSAKNSTEVFTYVVNGEKPLVAFDIKSGIYNKSPLSIKVLVDDVHNKTPDLNASLTIKDESGKTISHNAGVFEAQGDGAHSYTARYTAPDDEKVFGEQTLEIVLDTIAPKEVSLVSIKQGDKEIKSENGLYSLNSSASATVSLNVKDVETGTGIKSVTVKCGDNPFDATPIETDDKGNGVWVATIGTSVSGTLTAVAVDRAENTSTSLPLNAKLQFDANPPNVTVTVRDSDGNRGAYKANEWYNGDVTVFIEATEPQSESGVVYISLAGEAEDLAPSYLAERSFSVKGDGEHSEKLIVRDAAGNEATQTLFIGIDSVAPTGTAALKTKSALVEDGTVYVKPKAQIMVTGVDKTSGIVKSKLKGSDIDKTNSMTGSTTNFYVDAPLSDNVSVYLYDKAGNKSESILVTCEGKKIEKLVVDETSPEMGDVAYGVDKENVTLTFNARDSLSGIHYITVRSASDTSLKEVSRKYSENESPISIVIKNSEFTGLGSDSKIKLTVSVHDKAGNVMEKTTEPFNPFVEIKPKTPTELPSDTGLATPSVKLSLFGDEKELDFEEGKTKWYESFEVKIEPNFHGNKADNSVEIIVSPPNKNPVKYETTDIATTLSFGGAGTDYKDEGAYEIKVTPKSGKVNGETKTITVGLDKTAPNVEFYPEQNGQKVESDTVQGSFVLKYKVTDLGSGVATQGTVTYQFEPYGGSGYTSAEATLDGATFTAIGTYKFTAAESTDNLKNTTDSSSFTIKLEPELSEADKTVVTSETNAVVNKVLGITGDENSGESTLEIAKPEDLSPTTIKSNIYKALSNDYPTLQVNVDVSFRDNYGRKVLLNSLKPKENYKMTLDVAIPSADYTSSVEQKITIKGK